MAEMTEAKIYEALGLEMPAAVETAGNPQETAAASEPRTDAPSTEEGARAQEIAEPAQGDGNASSESGNNPVSATGNAEGEPGTTGENQPQTPEERHANAARRRQQELTATVNAAVEKARQEEQAKVAQTIKELFEKTGLKNTITGEAITTMEELNNWQRQMRQAQAEKDLKAGKLTTETLNQLIEDHPAVQKAGELHRQQEQAQTQRQQEETRVRIEGEIAQIGQMDPNIKSVADLLTMPKAREFYDYVNRGYSFIDAYRLAHFEEITRRNADAARQQAQTSARSKEHLTVTGSGRAEGAASVPADQMQLYRMLNPGVTEADIQKHFNKYQKRGG